MIKILVADDHAVVREGIKQIVADTFDMLVAGEAASCQEVLELVSRDDWDVVLLDISMPRRGGLETLRQLKAERPQLPVLILSIHPEGQYAVRTLKAGASGYLTKESAPDELVAAIRKVSTGGKYVSSYLAEKLASFLVMDAKEPLHETLSDREYQVMCMIGSGKTVTQIAEELYLSVKTVSSHRANILRKMHMKNNAEITYYVIKQGLVP